MKKRYIISFVVAIIILSVLFLWNVGAGSVDISTSDLFAILAGSGKDETFSQIVWKIRLPRILAAILLGGALSVSGFLLQSFFQNPIAGPYVLGISSGAKLVVALTMIFLLEKGIMISSFGMVMAAFVGSMLAMGFVLLISFRVSKMSLLVVCGIMIGYICSAITDFCVTFASDSNIVNLHNWSMGSFSGMTWENIKMIVVIVGVAVLVTFCLAKPIGAYQMGEAYARNIGVNVKVLRVTMILLSSLLSACVTAFAGPISFVGIAVPHLVRMATKTARPIILIPGCFLCGAVVTLFCDGIARTVFAPTEISISSVTALFLVPVVIAAMLRKQEGRESYMQEIRTEHLTVGYDKTPLIGDVNLSVRPGEILTLIGPNGSGKSTILKTITKQLKKLDGTVFLGEASMDELKDSQISRRLSMVMTERLRTELMSGREVVASGRYPYTGRFGILSKEDWAKVDEAIALVHAGEVQDQDFMKISDGQRQRLMLARAICQDTKILILDEPTSYLDMGFKMDILTNIRMLARDKKMAVIMSLHELDLAQKVSDTIACVRGDRIDCVGTPEEIFAGNYVQELYGVADQSFDPVTGQIFLCTGYEKAVVSRDFSAENCSGKNFGCGKKNPDPVSPQFFVIGGAGSGIPVYNRLWRENIPFAAGILQENDVEYKAAVALASEVVAEKAFYPVGQDKVQAAKQLIDSCKKCICAVEEFGPLNEAKRELAEYARRIGKTGKNI